MEETNLSEELLLEIKDFKERKMKEDLHDVIGGDAQELFVKTKNLTLRDQKEIDECIGYLQKGSTGKIDLNNEYAVIDFIADYMLSNNDVTIAFQFCHDLISYNFSDNRGHDYLANLFVKNLFKILTTPLSRRNDQTLLHLAAYDGAENVIILALRVIHQFVKVNNVERSSAGNHGIVKLLKLSDFIDMTDSDKKTPFYRALEGKHGVISDILLKNGANPNLKANSDIVVTLLDSVDAIGQPVVINVDQVQQPRFDWSRFDNMEGLLELSDEALLADGDKMNSNSFYMKKTAVACPMIILNLQATKKGIYMYEVEIEESTIGHQLFVGWTTNASTAKTIKYVEGYKNFCEVSHVGCDSEFPSVSLCRGTRSVICSKLVCCNNAHLLHKRSAADHWVCQAIKEPGGCKGDSDKIMKPFFNCFDCDYNLCESCYESKKPREPLQKFLPDYWGGKDRILQCKNLV